MGTPLRILALEGYYGGSPRAFLDSVIAGSSHAWTVLSEPASHWKWRMFHSSITLADKARALVEAGEEFDVLLCGGMVNLAEFRAFAPADISSLPSVLYVHENQIAYPLRDGQKQDYRFGLIQLASALAADRVWFNSEYNRATMLDGLAAWFKTLPPAGMAAKLPLVRDRSEIVYPGVALPQVVARDGRTGPLHILWAHRWEYDKQPAVLLGALRELRRRGVEFRLSVIGEQFRTHPGEFETIHAEFAEAIVRWGYQPTREDYLAALAEADVAVSTASHEFFGIGMVEAAGAGCAVALPDDLAYPDVFGREENPEWFYPSGEANALAKMLAGLSPETAAERGMAARRRVERYELAASVAAMDSKLLALAEMGTTHE